MRSVARRARQWATHHKLPCVTAFATGSGPTAAEAVRSLRSQGRRHIAVGSWFLAPGPALHQASALALEHGAVAVADPLGAEPEVTETVLVRYLVAAMELVDLDLPELDEETEPAPVRHLRSSARNSRDPQLRRLGAARFATSKSGGWPTEAEGSEVLEQQLGDRPSCDTTCGRPERRTTARRRYCTAPAPPRTPRRRPATWRRSSTSPGLYFQYLVGSSSRAASRSFCSSAETCRKHLIDRRAGRGELRLPGVDRPVAARPDPARDELVHPDHQHVLVVGAVEDPDHAGRRQLPRDPPQERVGALLGGRLLERLDLDALRVDHARSRAGSRRPCRRCPSPAAPPRCSAHRARRPGRPRTAAPADPTGPARSLPGPLRRGSCPCPGTPAWPTGSAKLRSTGPRGSRSRSANGGSVLAGLSDFFLAMAASCRTSETAPRLGAGSVLTEDLT